jgi:hypothetical protein
MSVKGTGVGEFKNHDKRAKNIFHPSIHRVESPHEGEALKRRASFRSALP